MKKNLKHFKVKLIKNRKLSGMIFKFLILISLIFLFICSEDELLSFLNSTFFKKLFINSLSGNSIIFNLSLGYIVSSIFYLIVVYIPEKRKIEDLKPHLNNKIESVIFGIKAIIYEIIRNSKKEIKITEITKINLKEMCMKINPEKIDVSFHNNGSHFKKHLGYSFFNSWCRILKNIDEILRYIPFIDTSLISILNEIENSNLGITINELKIIEKIGNNDMTAWSNNFYDLLKLGQKLAKYYKDNINEEYKNPFV